MRILQIITNLTSGGAEKLVCDITIEMKKLGHKIDVLILFDKDNIYVETLKKARNRG